MEHILYRFRCSPLVKLMLLVAHQFPSISIPLFPTPDSKPVESGCVGPSILGVKEGDPGINLLDNLVMINMVGWWWTIVSKPYELRWSHSNT